MYIYIKKQTKKTETMTNLIDTLTETIKSEINLYGVTEIFVMDGEVYITSSFDVPFDLIEKIEEEV
jgi:hypothetical protein